MSSDSHGGLAAMIRLAQRRSPVPFDGRAIVSAPVAARPAASSPTRATAPVRTSVATAAAAPDVDEVRELTKGSIFLTLGVLVTFGSYLFAGPGGRFRVMAASLVLGLYWLGRGVVWCFRNDRESPWRAIAAAAIPPVAVAWGLWSYAGIRQEDEVNTIREVALQADAARAQAIAESRRRAADEERARRQNTDIARLVASLGNARSPMAQCEAALALGDSGKPEALTPLLDALATGSDNLQSCAGSALVRLGEGARMLPVFVEWAKGTGDLQRAGLSGFGEIGPAAAEVALPLLAEGAKSTDVNVQAVSIRSLTEIGPAAEPLLETLRQHPDPMVRQIASGALTRKR